MRFPARLVAVVACTAALLAGRPAFAEIPVLDSDLYETEEGAHYVRNTALVSALTLSSIAVNAVNAHAPGWVGAAGFLGGTLQVVYATRFPFVHNTSRAFNYFVGGAAVLTGLSALSRGGGNRSEALNGTHLSPLLGMDVDRHAMVGAALSF